MGRVLVTGGAGRIATALRDGLDRPLRLLDVVGMSPSDRDEVVVGDLCSPSVMAAACAGVSAVVHLGGIASEAPFADLLRVNVDGTRVVLEAAAAAGVRRVVLASSIHAAGFYSRPAGVAGSRGAAAAAAAGLSGTGASAGGRDSADGVGSPGAGLSGRSEPEPSRGPGRGDVMGVGSAGGELPATAPARPDSYYGWSKAAVESLGSLYADRYGMSIFALRIGAWIDRPDSAHLDSWISPADGVRLVAACLDAPNSGFRVIWGVSANPGRWLSLTEGQEIGYRPQDASEAPASPGVGPLGTVYAVHPLGQPL